MIRRERIVLSILMLSVGIFALFLLALYITDNQVSVRLSKFDAPKSVREHRELEVAIARRSQNSSGNETDSHDRLARYVDSARLLARIEDAWWDLVDDHWTTVWMVDMMLKSGRLNDLPLEEVEYDDVESLMRDSNGMRADLHALAQLEFVAAGLGDTPYTESFRDARVFDFSAQLLSISAAYYSYTSARRAAFEDIQTGLRLAQTLLHEPSLSSQQAGLELAESMTWALPREFDAGSLPNSWLDELLPQLHGVESLRTALDSLGAAAADSVRVRHLPIGDWALQEWVELRGVYWGTRNWIWGKPVCRPMTNLDDLSYLDTGDRILAIPDVPYFQMKPHLDELIEYGESLSIVCHGSRRFPMQVEHVLARLTRSTVQLDITRIGLQIERYFEKHQHYPESLDLIASTESLPADPFTGSGYLYTRGSNGFLLHSPGIDQVDQIGNLASQIAAKYGESHSSEDDMLEVTVTRHHLLVAYEQEHVGFVDDIVWRPVTYLESRQHDLGAQSPDD